MLRPVYLIVIVIPDLIGMLPHNWRGNFFWSNLTQKAEAEALLLDRR